MHTKNQDNAQLKAHYPIFRVCNIFLGILLAMFIAPKHLNLFAGGMPTGNSAFNPAEGYRTPSTSKTTQTPQNKNPSKQGGASVFIALYAWPPDGSCKRPLSSG